MELVFISGVLLVTLAFLAYPFFKPTPKARQMDAARETLTAERDAAYAALRDLDFDFQLGKLSESDHNARRARYKAHAAAILQQFDALPAPNTASVPGEPTPPPQREEAEDWIEREVARLRGKARPASLTPAEPADDAELEEVQDDWVEREVARKRQPRAERHCPNCGKPHAAGDKFCARCGNKL